MVLMLIASLQIIFGLALLVWSADRFVVGAAGIATNFGVSRLLVGLTIVAFGTSAPEIFVALMASLKGSRDLAIGNALGSNIANIGLVLGAAALVAPLKVHKQVVRQEYPLLLLIMLLVAGMLLEGQLTRWDGVVLFAAMITLVVWWVWQGLSSHGKLPEVGGLDEVAQPISNSKAVGWFLLGLVLLPVSSEVLVKGAVTTAQWLGVSDLIIGLTVVAIGTSLPELVAAVASAHKKEHDIALGNVVGSNMFNSLAVIAVPGLVSPGPIDTSVVYRDVPLQFAITILLFIMSITRKRRGVIQRWQGGVLLLCYAAYLVALVYDASF